MRVRIDPAIVEQVLDLAVQIQQVPAPTFEENQRAEFIYSQFSHAGAPGSFIDENGNVYTHIPGRGERPPLVITAHLDTVFPMHTDLAITRTPDRISGPGIGDNSLGVATLFGLYRALGGGDEKKAMPHLPGDLWLVANVAEEGLGNLKGMKAVVDRFGGGVLAYLVLEGMSLGQIYHRGLGVRRYQVQVHARGGHSWVDYGSPSAIHELAELVVRFTHLPLPVEPRTSLNVGVISGGTTVNTIAADASLLLDIRSVSPLVLDEISMQVQELVEEANRKRGEAVCVEARMIGDRPAGEIPADHPLVCLARSCYEARGIKVRLNIGSTDTNLPLSRGLPAICVGLTTGGGAHTRGEFINTGPYPDGLAALVDLVRIIFKQGVGT